MSTRTVLLRLNNHGEPVNHEKAHNGVLIVPPLELPVDYKVGDAIYIIRFHIGATSPLTHKGVFHINAPKSSNDEFQRDKFYEYPIANDFYKDSIIDIPLYTTGSFAFYSSYEDGNGTGEGSKIITKKFYFNVAPNLRIQGKFVALNNINIQSICSKFIGPIDKWDSIFKYIRKKGYNMIHFTPLQYRGESNSPYSIFDQLRFDPTLFSSNDEAIAFLKKVVTDNNLFAMTDIVLNHTANNSEWLIEHPDAGYNAETAPHLKSAIELDLALREYSNSLGKYDLPTYINSTDDLHRIMEGLSEHVFVKLKLWQYYVVDRVGTLANLEAAYKEHGANISPVDVPSDLDRGDLKQVADFTWRVAGPGDGRKLESRFSNALNSHKLLAIVLKIVSNDSDASRVLDEAGRIIDEINVAFYKDYDEDVHTIKNQLFNRTAYLYLDHNGPLKGKQITEKEPFIETYFTIFKDSTGKQWECANNGWLWGGDPLVDFASNKSKAYLRREVIVWGDCVKLRYGNGPEDSPYLWERMIKYSRFCAEVFEGFRIDNCHSTPLHVGERLLDEARKVNPHLYVVAELFTGSEETDKLFVEKLGINSLIREAMLAWSVQDLSRLIHKHGGKPIGSLTLLPLDEVSYPCANEPDFATYRACATELEIPTFVSHQQPHALFMDCSHDNETPYQKRTVEDTLPTGALVAFCSSAIGSVFGYDECYPFLLDIVHEKRQYTYGKNGIAEVKARLHEVREKLALESDDIANDHEMYIHHEGQYITIQRYNTKTGKGWYLIARNKFSDYYDQQMLSPVHLGGTQVKLEFAYSLKKTVDPEKNPEYITGIPVTVEELELPPVQYDGHESLITVDERFVPGSIAVFSTTIPHVDITLDKFIREGAIVASEKLDYNDLNALLYRCENEERDYSHGAEGCYDIPDYGKLVYAGLGGWISALKPVIYQNNLAHPICNHLRQGEWAMDYVVNRLDKYAENSSGLGEFRDWLKSRIEAIKVAPYFLRPHYFALVLGIAYEAARFRALRLSTRLIQVGGNFLQDLALTSVQMVGKMKGPSIFPFEQVPCLAAGLPHFSSDYMRCWGRDVFISFRGLLLVPERYEDAKLHILGFAKTLKHGLIPNLLDSGRNPRFNARDAAWFFMQAIQDYIIKVPNGIEILKEKVTRRFPLDDTWVPVDDPRAFSHESTIEEIVYEIFLRHAGGIKYREANAGPNLDSQMKPEGFNVEVYVDWNTGLIHGGSQWNCGTWMDKMGESEKAGNKGYPGTPRDGAAVELQGLLKSGLRFFNNLHDKGLFKYSSVKRQDGSTVGLKEWETLIQNNFERCFYVPIDPLDDYKFEVDGLIVNRRGIYKDLFRLGKPFEDYQLRPNFAISMVVAPELFDAKRAVGAIDVADSAIRGPVGMRTLDPSDWNYRPYYNNGVDDYDFATSKGRNYHQGPEWVWCYGYFMRAYHHFKQGTNQHHLHELNMRLMHHVDWIKNSEWAGLTELTNKDAEYCKDSSPTQAWSTSCLLDLYHDVYHGLR
ncbi:uncharacterized protein KQ657_003725 [Scheffersomyces spartinae]|uniref:Glycogen debranching enzyme n=1 Tax=Scheffersomyces spartinae TaxID=45513 RepID=A0A9P7VC13_9ASCO|nr:uncharacterized protein KQ657_003725 [Scheffersomyces spartinae]KAG7195199.1 hypothetical protein KQ657_003725 [Scheffersomyces spartinae]